MSDPNARRESIVAYVRENITVPLAELCRWATTHWHCSDSTVYDDVARLVAHHKLQRLPTGHGDVLAMGGALRVADPALVRESAKRVLNSHLKDELRTACAADLRQLSERSDILPDDLLLKLFQSAVQDAKFPGRAQTLDALRNVAKRTAAHTASTGGARDSDAGDLDWPEMLAKLRQREGPTLLDQIGRDIGNASWACDILLDLWAGTPEEKLVLELLDLALTKAHPIPSYDAALPGLAGALGRAITENGQDALKNRVRLKLDQALNAANERIRDQARSLRNELRQDILPRT